MAPRRGLSLGLPVDDTPKHDNKWEIRWGSGEVWWSCGDLTVRLGGT